MATTKTDILVYAHWMGMKEPKLIGILSAQQAKGKKAFSFEYSSDWIHSSEQILLDPDIGWYKGQQYPNGKENFGVFFDSMPDTWGRTLMKRRSALNAKEEGRPAPNLYDIDFLLGVFDSYSGPVVDLVFNKNINKLTLLQTYWQSVKDVEYIKTQLGMQGKNEVKRIDELIINLEEASYEVQVSE